MNFFPADSGGGLAVQSYGPGGVMINGELLAHNLVLTPERIIRNWRPSGFADLTDSDFADLAGLEPEILLLGTGRRQRFPAAEIYAELIRRGIGLEVMDTGAACRTYNILMSERRRVVAALLMIEDD